MPARPRSEVGLRLRIVLRTLREEDAAATLDAIAAGTVARCLLPWIPLMRGAGEAAIIEKWKELAAAEADVNYRADCGYMAWTFAGLTNHFNLWDQGLKGWNMIEWPVFRRVRVETTREDLLRALRLRYPTPIAPELAETIKASTDLDELRRWFDAACTAPDLNAFRAAIDH